MNKLLIPLFIAALLFCSCTKKAAHAPPAATPVMIITTKAKNIPFYIDTLGHFAAFNTVTVQAQVQGELTGLYFEEGQPVNKGELLFTIDKRPYQAVLDKTIATLKQNEATLAYDLSRQERYSGLVEDDFVSQLQYTQYVTELESQEAIIQENQAEINSAAINVGFCSITSPISGITGKRLIDVGNIITDVGSKMLVVNQISPLFVDFSIPERLFDAVHEMQQRDPLLIEVFVPNTNLVTHARVQMLDNTINPDTGMIALRGILPNNEQLFWPQQFVRIRLIIDILPNSIMIPPEAVVATSSGDIVWVVSDDGTVAINHIKVGEEYESELRVIKGLKVGQRIVTKGQLPLRPGIKVSIKDKEDDLK